MAGKKKIFRIVVLCVGVVFLRVESGHFLRGQIIVSEYGHLSEETRPTSTLNMSGPCTPTGGTYSVSSAFTNPSNAYDTNLNTYADSGLISAGGGHNLGGSQDISVSTASFNAFESPAHGVIHSWLVATSSTANTSVAQGDGGGENCNGTICSSQPAGFVDYVVAASTSETDITNLSNSDVYTISSALGNYGITTYRIPVPNFSNWYVMAYVCVESANSFYDCGINGTSTTCHYTGVQSSGEMSLFDVHLEREYATGAKKAAPQ